VEHDRCAHCRNPIRVPQPRVDHTEAGVSFHLDCWQTLHEHVQQDYLRRVADDGIEGLLRPYSRSRPVDWLPRQPEDASVEVLGQVDEVEPATS